MSKRAQFACIIPNCHLPYFTKAKTICFFLKKNNTKDRYITTKKFPRASTPWVCPQNSRNLRLIEAQVSSPFSSECCQLNAPCLVSALQNSDQPFDNCKNCKKNIILANNNSINDDQYMIILN